jgi:acetyl-CoA carboxylase biotin carboxyl carrier protein
LDLKQIKQIIDLMKRSDLTDFSVEEEGFKLAIRRNSTGQPVVASGQYSMPPFPVQMEPAGSAPSAMQVAPAAVAPNATSSDKEEVGITYIKSPMVGTFYRAPSPESAPFVDLNAKVSENTVVCIIEAMKIMNEIQAETKGSIVEILVENGQPVEYGQRLFRVKVG